MLKKSPSHFTKSMIFFIVSVVLFPPAFGTEEGFFGLPFNQEKKHRLEITKTEHYWHTEFFRPTEPLSSWIYRPLSTSQNDKLPQEIFPYGGTVIGEEDVREQIEDTKHEYWRAFGLLTTGIEGNPIGSGTLISPWHVLTSGRTLYDPEKEKWAEDIYFHPARSGDHLPVEPVVCVKKAVFSSWKYGNPKSDMGIVELSQPIGKEIGWNGLLWGDDSYLNDLDTINISGYPADKPLGTMWTDFDEIHEIENQQFTHKAHCSQGQNGASIWILRNQPKGVYSLGVQTCGVKDEGVGVFNVAARLTQRKIQGIVNLINNLF